MIDQDTIQRIFDSADIYDVISDFVNLKKRGVNYVGCCPFHDEKTASFTVSPSKGIYKCFGCGKGGNVVNFIMEHEQMTYVEALRYLGMRYNIPIEEKVQTEEEIRKRTSRESMYIVLEAAQRFFSNNIENTDEGRTVGFGYFKRRGLDEETIKKFGLGYSPEQWDALTQYLSNKGYQKEFLLETGLSIDNDKGMFDRFKGRVMFPIQNLAGKIIGFGGRIMTNEKKSAKYLNSPESEIYHKSKTLYGIHAAKKSIVKNNLCYLVEGYLDVISFHMRKIENTVASSGTSLTVEQIHLIRRLTPNVTIIYDGDSAGIKASLRGIDLVLQEGLNVRIVSLPEGEDPDSYAQNHSRAELEHYIEEHEQDFISFKTKLLLDGVGDDPFEKSKVINDIVKSISLIPDDITRATFVKEISSKLGVGENTIYSTIIKFRKGHDDETRKHNYFADRKKESEEKQKVESVSIDDVILKINPYLNEERELMRLLLRHGRAELYEDKGRIITADEYILRSLKNDNIKVYDKLYDKILNIYNEHLFDNNFEPESFFTMYSDQEITTCVADLLSDKYDLSNKFWQQSEKLKTGDEFATAVLPKILNNYKMKILNVRCKQVDKKISDLVSQKASDEEILIWLEKKTKIDKIRQSLNDKLDRIGIN